MKLVDLLSDTSFTNILRISENATITEDPIPILKPKSFKRGPRLYPERERLDSVTIFGEKFIFSPAYYNVEEVEGVWTRTPHLPPWLSELKKLEESDRCNVALIHKSMNIEMGLAATRAMAIGGRVYQAPVATSNAMPPGAIAFLNDRIWVNEDWGTQHHIDNDGDRAYSQIFQILDKLLAANRKFPMHTLLVPQEVVEKPNDRFIDFTQEDWATIAKENPPVYYDEKKWDEVFIRLHSPGNIGIKTNILNLHDLRMTMGMTWQQKLNNFPSFVNDERMETIEGSMSVARGRDGILTARAQTMRLKGLMPLLTGIGGVSGGKCDISPLWGDNWKEELARVYCLQVNEADFEPVVRPKKPRPGPKRLKAVDGTLLKRLAKTGTLRVKPIGKVFGTNLTSYVVWMRNASGKDCVFLDTKRNAHAKSEFLSYAAILHPVFDPKRGWMDPIKHLQEYLTVYQYRKYVDGEAITYCTTECGKIDESKGFNSLTGGNKFLQTRKDLENFPTKTERLRKVLADYVDKYGTTLTTTWVKDEKGRPTPHLEEYQVNRVRTQIAVDYTGFETIEGRRRVYDAARQGVKFHPATKAKDTNVRLYAVDNANGLPFFGKPGNELRRCFGGRSFLMTSPGIKMRVAIIQSSTTKQQTFITPEGLAITPKYKGNCRVFTDEEQYIGWLDELGIEASEDDSVVHETLSGKKRRWWVGPAKAVIEVPKFVTPNGFKTFPVKTHSIDTWSGPIHMVVPIEELVAKGLHHEWMEGAAPATVTINGDEVECFINEVRLHRSGTPSENTPTGESFMWTRGFFERYQLDSVRQSMYVLAGGNKDDVLPTRMGSTFYMETLRTQRTQILSLVSTKVSVTPTETTSGDWGYDA